MRQLDSFGDIEPALAKLRMTFERIQQLQAKAPDEQQLVLLWGNANLLNGDLVYTQGLSDGARRYWLVAYLWSRGYRYPGFEMN